MKFKHRTDQNTTAIIDMNPEEQRIRVVRFYSQQSRCYHNLKSSNSIFSKTTHRTDLKQKPKLILVARRRRCQKRISFIFDVCGRNSRKNEIFNTSDRFSRYLRIGPTKKVDISPREHKILLGPFYSFST